jgi:tetratricopeptide (TPR) repeat protein
MPVKRFDLLHFGRFVFKPPEETSAGVQNFVRLPYAITRGTFPVSPHARSKPFSPEGMEPSHGHARPSFLSAPPLTESEGPEGVFILEEQQGVVGLALFGAYRDVMVWLRASEKRKPTLFPAASWKARRVQLSRLPGSLSIREALLSLIAITEGGGVGELDVVAKACVEIASWAESVPAPATRLSFTQAAALASPTSARLALDAGKQARDLADYARSETWIRRAIRIARRTRDWETYLWSYIALAILYMRLGNYPASHAVTERVLRASRHHRMKDMEGLAFHQFFILEAQSDHPKKAYEYARLALSSYGSTHPRLTALAHDVARFWSEHSQFSRSLPVFLASLPRITRPEERAVVAANVAWAAAGVGARSLYEESRLEALTLLARSCGETRAAEVLSTVAFADVCLGEWERATNAADEALQITIRRREHDLKILAEDAVKRARGGRDEQDRGVGEAPTVAWQADHLVSELVSILQEA